MSDVYATIADADPALVARLADALETRAADAQQRAMLEAYLADVRFPEGARVLEAGCGTGPVARTIAGRRGVAEVIGVDPSPILLGRARELSRSVPNLSFQEGDARALPFADAEFDVVVFHTTLCHVPTCDRALAEAHRVLKPGGCLAVFDGDYATTSVAIGEHDPLDACAKAAVANIVHDPWLVRRLPALVRAAGFTVVAFRSHGYVQTAEPAYMLTIVDRGADFMAMAGQIGAELAEALKGEARRRVAEDRFYGQIAYASLVAERGETADPG